MKLRNPFGKRTAAWLFFPVLLTFCLMSSGPPLPAWGSTPSLEAVLSPYDGGVKLAWEPRAGATAYQVFRAPLKQGPYQFTLLAELDASQTFFSDNPQDTGSVVYQVVARGPGINDYAYPLAARLTVERFGGLVPVSLAFHPNTPAAALASLDTYENIRDANSGNILSSSCQLRPGMVLKVEGFGGQNLTLVGTAPPAAAFRFDPNEYRLFAVPLTFDRLRLKDLQSLGLKGAAAHSFVCSDGNNLQIEDTAVYIPGQVYGLRFDRGTEIDFLHKGILQGSFAVPSQVSRPQLLGGSPDDGTQVVVLYDAAYETRLYKCWSSGKSGAWDGITDNASGADNVKNAAVVRRGRTMYVKDEAGMSDTTPVTVLAPAAPGNPRQTLGWNVSWDAGRQAAAIQIPAGAPVGDYQVRVGANPENYVTVYIIFDPGFAAGYLDTNEYRSWAYYDDDWQTVPDFKHYLNYVFEGPGFPLGSLNYVYGYRGNSSSESGADGGVFGQRYVEMAGSIHGAGAQTPVEAALHTYQVIGQRVSWVSGNGWYGNDNGEYNTFDDTLEGYIKAPSGIVTATELDVVTAERAALGLGWTNRLPSGYVLNAGACFNYGTCLAAMFRSIGIPGRCQHSIGGDGWTSSFHAWAEAFLDQPEIHPLDPNWWDNYWYEFDCNNYYTGHSTSHSEGSITPIVINGYGDYLINEYIQCEGIGYDGSFYLNSFKCTPPGSNTGTHTVVPLQNGTTNDAEDYDSYPLVISYNTTSSAWQLMNMFVPFDGPADPSGDPYVYDSHHGYALNNTQTGPDGGAGFIDDSTNENDLPILMDGIEQRGLIGGWGFMMYRVPVNGRPTITVQLLEGADRVEILACLDRNIYSTDRRWDLDYDFMSDGSGLLTANSEGGSQLYLWIQLKGFSHANPGLGQETAWYTIRVGDSAPYVNAQFSYDRLSDYEVQFSDESIAYNDTIVSWDWDFGDGNTSTAQNPSHTYTSAAYFDVTLTVTGDSGTGDSQTQQVWIGPNQGPTADFTYSDMGGNMVNFYDQSSDPDGTIQSWSWNFGDGGTSTEQNPSHTYASPGTYSVSLTVTDDDGATDSVTHDVSVTLKYCASSSSSDTFHITQVNIGSFSNSSSGSTYSDFTNQIVYMDPGGSYAATIKVNDSFWTGYTRIWIDYNRDGDFIDANELVFQKAQSGGQITGTITVPSSGVVTGLKLGMRIHTDSMSYKDPCDQASGWGEVEDYSVILSGSGGNLPPNANFTTTSDGLTVNFTDTSTDSDGTIQSWSWNFGDGNTSTVQNPSHTYASDGTYTVTLTVTDNGGASDSTAKQVSVSSGGNTPPSGDFTYTTDGLTVLFTDQSSDSDGTVQSWAWDFGDGKTSSAQNVGHTFTAAGTYTVSLTVTDNDGGSDSASKSVSVSSENHPPEADFSFSADGLAVDFTDDSRDPDPDGTIVNWSWDFGDGNTSTEQNPSHTYAASDTYSVSLTVTDNNSNTDSVSKDVTVNGTGNTPPTADFTYTTEGLTANFTDASTDPDGTIESWSWNFGDGNTSSQQNPSHTYASAGTYSVSLTVTDDGGATDSTSKNVTVSAPNLPPTADFTYTTSNLTATFTDTSTDSDGTIQSWSWNFGDGNTSTQQNPSHTYASAGTYSVSLTVTDDDGATDSTAKDVTVTSIQNQPPTADFTYTTSNLTANFTDTSTDSDGTIQSWSWNFGDGNTSTQQNPSHTYASAGTYSVTLTVTDDDDASDSVSKNVTVSDGGGVPDYCPSSSSSADPMAISQVAVADLTNPSGKSTYSDFTNLTINMQKGQSYSVTINLDNSFYSAYTRIWIDFNRDGDFDDSGELVLQKSKKGKVTGTITVPTSGVVTGQKLGLRIHADTMSYRGPCSVGWGWGEVEDYAVIVQD